jgi:hypothetical protein
MWEQRGGESGAQLGTTLAITSTNICTKKRYEVHDHILLMKRQNSTFHLVCNKPNFQWCNALFPVYYPTQTSSRQSRLFMHLICCEMHLVHKLKRIGSNSCCKDFNLVDISIPPH